MGAVLGEPERYVKEGFGKWHLSVYGPFWGTWRGLLYQGLLEMDMGGLWKWSVSLYGNSARGTWRALLVGTLKNMLSNALELGVFLHMGHIWAPWSRHSFLPGTSGER